MNPGTASEIRLKHLADVKSVVIKLGTQLLSDGSGRLDADFIARIAGQVAGLAAMGVRVSIVSSGAIGAGLRELNLPKRPTDLAKLQATAAVGQRRLMDVWANAFAPHSMPVGQILLTREDIDSRQRFLNLRNTVTALHELNAVPIINENDTVSTDEIVKITFGDNDILAASVTHALHADLLVLLTVVDGVLDDSGKVLRLVENLESAQQHVRSEKSQLGKGGMNSKFSAARQVTEAGCALVVANGREPGILTKLLAGEEVGTLFVPAGRKRSSWARWIGSVRPEGKIVVDEGAVKALVEKNRSLLAAGVKSVEGEFAVGAVVAVAGPDGRVMARGLTNYSSADVQRVAGKKTAEVRSLVGEAAYDEVVHRDNLVVS